MQQEVHLKSGLGQLDRLGRVAHVRLGAAIALALAAAFIVWVVVRNDGHSATTGSSAVSKPLAGPAIPQTAGTGPVAASAQDLKRFAAASGHPVFWAGPMSGRTYELTQTRTGRVYVRYLPPGVSVGANKWFLTIATYPFPRAFAALDALAKHQGGKIALDNGGIGLVDKAYPKSVHVAYPGVDYEIEVFSPSPAHSRQVVVSHRVAVIR